MEKPPRVSRSNAHRCARFLYQQPAFAHFSHTLYLPLALRDGIVPCTGRGKGKAIRRIAEIVEAMAEAAQERRPARPDAIAFACPSSHPSFCSSLSFIPKYSYSTIAITSARRTAADLVEIVYHSLVSARQDVSPRRHHPRHRRCAASFFHARTSAPTLVA